MGEVYNISDIRQPNKKFVIKTSLDKVELEKEARILKKVSKLTKQTPKIIAQGKLSKYKDQSFITANM